MSIIKEDVEILKNIDAKFLIDGSYEVSNYIVDKAEKVNR